MRFSLKRRFVKHYCTISLINAFMIELAYLLYCATNRSHSSFTSIHGVWLPKNSNKFIFNHIRPYYYSVSCQNLFESDVDELKRARVLLTNLTHLSLIADNHYNITYAECHAYRSERFNESFHVQDTIANRNFPLAFSIIMHENVQQFERLLRLIYRPQNYYCIHVDDDAPIHVFEGVKSIVQCFNNTFLSTKRERVLYETFSRLQADLNCMHDLIRYPSWKYLLNLANTELPLKTNSELVKILSIYRGFNDIEGRWKTRNTIRTDYVWQIVNRINQTSYSRHLKMTYEKKKLPPGNVKIVKGSVYGAFSRAFIKFIQTNTIAKELLDWSRDTLSPDEHYWATLNYNTHLHAPGGYKAKTDPTEWTARFVIWGKHNCKGFTIHGVCILSTVNLPSLYNRYELFANKFHLSIDPIAYQCLEEFIVNRSRANLPLYNANFYRKMPFLLPT